MEYEMNYSRPSLHPSVINTPAHQAFLGDKLSSISRARGQILVEALAPAKKAFTIPLTTVSLASNFDASINIRFRGAPTEASTWLWVDSGNSTLIVPDYGSISRLPHFNNNYRVLADTVREPWGCPAKIVCGPIEIPTRAGGSYSIPSCVFYACTDVNNEGKRTANLGTGWVSPWPKNGSISIQAPLSYNPSYPYAEFNYAPATAVMTAANEPKIAQDSSLTVLQAIPFGYHFFDILRDRPWMSLTPRSLRIGATTTTWPGNVSSPIAMVDTGGGPVFLSDPNKCVCTTDWPEEVQSPSWTAEGSVSCQSIRDNLTIEIGDEHKSISYHIDTSNMPDSVRGLTLVMCEKCSFMMDNPGMNIGGLSALFLDILIDYSSGCIGFKSKQLTVV
jgi:hypothetical protein